MNTNTRNSRILNSILPVNPVRDTETPGMYTSSLPENTTLYVLWFLCILISAVLIYYYQDDLQQVWANLTESIRSAFAPAPAPAPAATATATATPATQKKEDDHHEEEHEERSITSVIEKVLPTSGKQVFNVSSNKYTYYDAEPLCKALGAELATYDQVKEAWSKGADWCNYGWVKGQMAVYPTSQETYDKTQSGPEEGRNVCGHAGLNGGYFDNPELRYGVTCYGSKPSQNLHNDADIAKNTPTSPDALAYEKKVAEFKRGASNISVLPNNSHSWN